MDLLCCCRCFVLRSEHRRAVMSLLLLGIMKAEVQCWCCFVRNNNRTEKKKKNKEKKGMVLEGTEMCGGVVGFIVKWWCDGRE